MRTLSGLILFGLALGCQQAAATPTPEQAPSDTSQLQKAEVTPAITSKSEELLRSRPGAEIGTEVPFTLDGRRYIARFEEHDNKSGDPSRPPGKHKGITVYVAR